MRSLFDFSAGVIIGRVVCGRGCPIGKTDKEVIEDERCFK